VLGLKAVNCQSGDVLVEEQVTAAAKEKVLDALGDAASQMREQLGESLVSIKKYDKPLDEITTSSLDALQAYSQSNRAYEAKGYPDTLPYLNRAVELDPNFATAYTDLGLGYYYLGQVELANKNLKKAFDLRNRVSERERFYIEGIYYQGVTRELDKAIQVFTQWVQTYPNDDDAHVNLSDALGQAGRLRKKPPIFVSMYGCIQTNLNLLSI
jgi:tetratricopeptide (TPR) repeat protein